MWSYNYTDELYHYGVPGMRWGHRKADKIRNYSSAYNNKTRQWTKEPEGGSLKKQSAVLDAKNRVKLARNRSDKKNAKNSLKNAKKELKDGYKEYQLFEKDMHKKYGKSKNYIYDPDKKQLVNRKTHKSIKDYEYKGLRNYEAYKSTKISNIKNGIKIGASVSASVLAVFGSIKVSSMTKK